jgi:hypothetical protein
VSRSIAVAPGAPEGTTELLYRSVYVFARRHGAESLVASVDPMTLDIFREEYGIMFRALGPVQTPTSASIRCRSARR